MAEQEVLGFAEKLVSMFAFDSSDHKVTTRKLKKEKRNEKLKADLHDISV